MNKQTYITELRNRLGALGFHAETIDDENLQIYHAELQKRRDDDSDEKIIYFLKLNIDENEKAVYLFKKISCGSEEITDSDLESTLLTDQNGKTFAAADILQTVSQITLSHGLTLKQGEREQAETKKEETKAPPAAVPVYHKESAANSQDGTLQKRKSKKGKMIALVLAVILIAVLVIVLVLSNKPAGNTGNSEETSGAKSEASAGTSNTSEPVSSVPENPLVSVGVDKEDIGNIMNNQFYFATEEQIFYVSFDEAKLPHIYTRYKDATEKTSIFEGFGWNLVARDDWLYFVGNPGHGIDNTYNVYRIKKDGSYYERLNDTYSHNLFFYGDHLYYLQVHPDYSNLYSLKRSDPDGKNAVELTPNAAKAVIYKNKLYYNDNSGNLFRIDPDGKNTEVLFQFDSKIFVISRDRIIYACENGDIYSCDINGKDPVLLRENQDLAIGAMNTGDEKIFFTEYGKDDFDYTTYGYPYKISAMDFEGENEALLLEGSSSGFYMNIIGKKLMVFDYFRESTGDSALIGYIKTQSTNGGSIDILER